MSRDALDKIVAAVRAGLKDDEVIQRLNGESARVVDVISTGSVSLDMALGVGGWPRGRIVEVYGPESSGKTTMTLHAVAEAQKLGIASGFVDAEHALDPSYARNLGVNLDDLLLSQPDNGEQALEVVEALVTNGCGIVVVDSVAALVPRAEIDGDFGDAQMGLQARLMSQAMRKLTGLAHSKGALIIFINQIRMKIGVVYGNPETTSGGQALKFYASVRLDVRRKEAIKDGDRMIGNRTRIKVIKNKLAPPFREVEFDIFYGKGISKEGDLVDAAEHLGILEKAGAWFNFAGERVGHGREKTKEALAGNAALLAKLDAAVRERMRAGG